MNDFITNTLGVETVNEGRFRKSKSVKQKVLDSIRSEIKLLNERENLILKKVNKTVDGKLTEVNENRFWKPSNTQKDKVLFSVKVKGKIFGFGNEVDRYNPNYFICNNDKDELVDMLEDFHSKLETVDENNNDFWSLGKKSTDNS